MLSSSILPSLLRSGRAFGFLLLFALGPALSVGLGAEPSGGASTNVPPSVILHLPLALIRGQTNAIQFRGLGLTHITEIAILDAPQRSSAIFRSAGKAEVPKPLDAARAGDTQVSAELYLPQAASIASVRVALRAVDRATVTNEIFVIDADRGVDEKEPNGGFGQAQRIGVGKTIRGAIEKERDVDVYSFSAAAGDRIAIRIRAAEFGSALDSVLTLSDASGHSIGWNDDTAVGRDSEITASISTNGVYYVTVMDAHDRGGPIHAYLLSLERVAR